MSKELEENINKMMYNFISFSTDFVKRKYIEKCPRYWPLKDADGEEILDPETGTRFGEDESPEKFAELIASDIEKKSEGGITYINKAVVWVNANGLPNEDKLLRAGRMLELYGCKPWGELKQLLRSNEGSKAFE